MSNKRFHPTSAPVTPVACASGAPWPLRGLRLQVKHNVRQQGIEWTPDTLDLGIVNA